MELVIHEVEKISGSQPAETSSKSAKVATTSLEPAKLLGPSTSKGLPLETPKAGASKVTISEYFRRHPEFLERAQAKRTAKENKEVERKEKKEKERKRKSKEFKDLEKKEQKKKEGKIRDNEAKKVKESSGTDTITPAADMTLTTSTTEGPALDELPELPKSFYDDPSDRPNDIPLPKTPIPSIDEDFLPSSSMLTTSTPVVGNFANEHEFMEVNIYF